MLAHEILVGEPFEFLLSTHDGSAFNAPIQQHDDAQIRYARDLDEIILSVKERHWRVKCLFPGLHRTLWEIAAQNQPVVCWVAALQPPKGVINTVLLSVRRFMRLQDLPQDEMLTFPVNEGNFDALRKKIIQRIQISDADALQWLRDHTILKYGADELLMISAGNEGDLRESRAYRILGRGVALDVNYHAEKLSITRLVTYQGQRQSAPVTLVKGRFDFVNAGVASQTKQVSAAELERIVAATDSYLGVWQEYNQLERKILVEKARQFGWIAYQQCVQRPEGWRLQVKLSHMDKLEQLANLEEVDFEIAGSLPRELEADFDLELEPFDQREGLGRAVQCEAVDVEQGFIDIRSLNPEDAAPPPKSGFLFITLSGDRVRLKRRLHAWNRIRSGITPIPMLGLLIERSEMFTARSYPSHSLKPKELRKAFNGEPTTRQAEAIALALNTPDIALIQGPPGTGKTRVISALSQVLSWKAKEQGSVVGHILLTSYQHDAVINAANRSQVFGLPALKIGQRRFQETLVDQAESWALQTSAVLRNDPARTETVLPVAAIARRVHIMRLGYLRNPGSLRDTVDMLRDIYRETLTYIPEELSQAIIELARRLDSSFSLVQAQQEGGKELLLRAVKGLRITPQAFSDDGRDRAYELLQRAGRMGMLAPGEAQILQQAWDWEMPEPPDFLEDLASLQQRLTGLLIAPRMLEQANLPNVDVEELLGRAANFLYTAAQRDYRNPEVVVERFIDELENDPDGVRQALWHYTAVLAATCQQSVGRGMQHAKQIDEQSQSALEFETVIVDEAARSNPLDLLIPMSMARRRIILVGDHRQLPHMLEPEVERTLERSSEAAKEALGKSLFERLFNFLREQEHRDGIQRTVTLDQQYRMHPELGRFVSRTFYERHNPLEAFRSDARPASEFEHYLDGYKGKVAAWLDVPPNLGHESGGQSKFRRSEALCIAAEVENILNQDSHLTVGVISFYAAQVQEILSRMEKRGMAEEVNGNLQVDRRWIQNGVERLRVGTVDSFQGMEFDVVLLSVVRSRPPEAREIDQIAQRRRYGFLGLENRLCVAMSRQKRLLIVVGNQEMIQHPAAAEAVPGLVAFYRELCQGEYGIIQRFQP